MACHTIVIITELFYEAEVIISFSVSQPGNALQQSYARFTCITLLNCNTTTFPTQLNDVNTITSSRLETEIKFSRNSNCQKYRKVFP